MHATTTQLINNICYLLYNKVQSKGTYWVTISSATFAVDDFWCHKLHCTCEHVNTIATK